MIFTFQMLELEKEQNVELKKDNFHPASYNPLLKKQYPSGR